MLSFERVILTTIAFDPNNLVLKKNQTKQLYVWAPAIIEPKKTWTTMVTVKTEENV